jgi:hypothetical protein
VFPLFATGDVVIRGQFAVGVVDIGRFFEKTRNDPNAIIRGLGEVILEKTRSKKSRGLSL